MLDELVARWRDTRDLDTRSHDFVTLYFLKIKFSVNVMLMTVTK